MLAMIDYGTIVIKNGKVINQNIMFQDMFSCVGWTKEKVDGNFFAYVGNEKITLCFYKNFFHIYEDKEFVGEIWPNFSPVSSRKSHYIKTKNISIKVKTLSRCVHCAYFTIDGSYYKVIFGYGIDSCKRVWDRVKYNYLRKKTAKKVDKILNGYW